jgi:hypothetical protein
MLDLVNVKPKKRKRGNREKGREKKKDEAGETSVDRRVIPVLYAGEAGK